MMEATRFFLPPARRTSCFCAFLLSRLLLAGYGVGKACAFFGVDGDKRVVSPPHSGFSGRSPAPDDVRSKSRPPLMTPQSQIVFPIDMCPSDLL